MSTISLGKLLRRSRDERQWLRERPDAMDALLEHTRETLPHFGAQAVAWLGLGLGLG